MAIVTTSGLKKLYTEYAMKLFIATGVYPPESGGPATYVRLLEEKLPPHGFALNVLPFRTVRHLPPVVRHAAYFFKCLLRAFRADAVYALDTVSVGFPAALAALLLRKKFVVRVPGDYAWEQARQRFGVTDELDEFQHKKYGFMVELMRTLQRFVVGRARKVVVPSRYMKHIVEQWGAKNIQVIYSSIELPPPTAAPSNRPQGFLVVSSGRRVPWKGFDGIERVVAREKDWHLFIAEHMPRAESLGWVQTADVFVLNSTYEGLSHALVEAMSLGTPVIATRVGGNPELIEDKVDGLLIPSSNDDALYAALKEVEQNPDAAKARAHAARAKLKQFSIDETIGKVAAMLKGI